jgi:PTS system galactitol-specific IIC component
MPKGIIRAGAPSTPLDQAPAGVYLSIMDTIMPFLKDGLDAFFSFKAYVILPVFMLILALIARMRPKESLLAALRVGAGFAGVFLTFNFFVSQIGPAVRSMIEVRGLDFPVVDVGWPPLAAITWSSSLAALSIPLVIALNIVMLLTRTTRVLYVDIWNYWHFALIGALVQAVTGNTVLAVASILAIAVYTIKTADWSVPYVERESGYKGIAVSPVSVVGFLPYAALLDAAFDRIPFFRKLNWNPSAPAKGKTGEMEAEDAGVKPGREPIRLLQEPMTIGIGVGLFLSILAGYGVKDTLEMAVNVAAVMFILPRCGGLIGEGMGRISAAFKEMVEKRFTKVKGLSIAMDTGFLLTNPSVVTTGLILMPLSILIAFILPGNRLIPLGDLPNLISVMAVIVIVMRGNVVRSVIAGLPIVASFMLFASKMAPLYTRLSAGAGLAGVDAGQTITAFTDGGNQLRFWLFHLFQGNLAAILILPAVGAALWFSWRAHGKTRKKDVRSLSVNGSMDP